MKDLDQHQDYTHRTLKAAFSKAALWNYIDENPFKKIKSPKQVISLPIFITPEEF